MQPGIDIEKQAFRLPSNRQGILLGEIRMPAEKVEL
jgi:hypothetical protein